MAKVNTQHSEYLANLEIWGRCRAFTAGSDDVKGAGEAYLPKLGGQTDDEYLAYKARAQFYNATGRTVDGMAGLVMRIDPQFDLPPQLADLETDIDFKGTSLFEFSKQQVIETLVVGRSGILVDFPERPEDVTTKAQAQASGLRPYLAHYPAESIYSWRSERLAGATVLTQVVLMEKTETISTDDEFITETAIQFRVLDFDDIGYRQRVFRADGEGGDDWQQHGDDIHPTIGDQRLNEIPFVFIGTDTNTPSVQKPPIIDLVNVNWGHYMNSASFEHGAHFTALPTPVISGFNAPADEPIAIGSETFLVLTNHQAKAYFMEFSGAGLTTLESSMSKKESHMATLGARMLTQETKGVEAADTARIHRSGEAGVLASLAGSVTKGIRRALAIAAEWAGGNPEAVEFELNKDFMPVSMPPAMLKELLASWQSGGISREVYFANLQRGEIIGDDVDLEEMKTSIENDLPGDGGTAPDPPAE